MRYNVSGLLRSPTGTAREDDLEADLHLDDPDIVVLEPVRGQLRLTKVNEGILVEGELATEVELLCARCLAPTCAELVFELCEQFVPSVELPGGPPIGRDADSDEPDDAIRIDEFHVLDVSEVVRQAALLVIPLHPLCKEDCPGLCPECGKDLNEDKCDCRPEPDPRWETLKTMIDEAESADD